MRDQMLTLADVEPMFVTKYMHIIFGKAVDAALADHSGIMWDAIELAPMAGVDDPKRWHLHICDQRLMDDHRRLASRRGEVMMKSYPDATKDRLTAVALAQMGYASSGVADVMGTTLGGAKRLLSDAAKQMGLHILQTMPPDHIDQWPHAPIPYLGDRSKVVRWVAENTPQLTVQNWSVDSIWSDGDRHVSQTTDGELVHKWTNDKLVIRCPHGMVPSTNATASKRRTFARREGVRMGVKNSDGTCDCVSPLTQLGYY